MGDWLTWKGPTRPMLPPSPSKDRWSIPEPIARMAYREYVRRHGANQSFERLHERGGFSPMEIIDLLADALLRLDPEAGQGETDRG